MTVCREPGPPSDLQQASFLYSCGSPKRINVENIERLRRFAGDREQGRAYTGSDSAGEMTGSGGSRESAARELEEGHTPAGPLSLELARTLDDVSRAFKVGCRLVSQDMGIPNRSVTFSRFVNAGILAQPVRRDLRPGIVVTSQGRSPSILVDLAPAAIVEKIKKINQRQAAVLGLFSIEMLGLRWLPRAWEPEFLSHLETCRRSVGKLPVEEVDRRLEDISEWLSGPDFAKQLPLALPIVTDTALWDLEVINEPPRDREILKLAEAGRDLNKEEQLQVYVVICGYVLEEISRRRDDQRTRTQVETAGTAPRREDAPELGRNDALDFVATMSELRWTQRGRGVRGVVASWPNPAHDSVVEARVQSNILRVRRFLVGRDPLSDDEAHRLLIDAWKDLRSTFPEQQFPLDWAGVVPTWGPDWTKG